MKYLLILLLLISACTPKDEPVPDPKHWFKSTVRQPAKFKPPVIPVRKFPSGCSAHDWGCYVPEELSSATPGRIYVLEGLHKSDLECVLKHEGWHVQGWDHPPGFSDCG